MNIIRALACLLIVLFHYTHRYSSLFGTADASPVGLTFHLSFSWGHMGVCVFFMLSGFLIYYNVNPEAGPVLFLLKRVLRLYPTYFVAVATTWIVTSAFLVERSVSASTFLVNLTMLQSFFGVGDVDGVYWIFRYELVFYFLIFLLIAAKKIQHVLSISFAWMLFSVASLLLYEEFGTLPLKILTILSCSLYSSCFVCGIALCCVFLGKQTIFACAAVVVSAIVHFQWHDARYALFFLIAALSILVVVLGRIKSDRIAASKWLRPLAAVSAISYPLFLVHQNIGYAVLKRLSMAFHDCPAELLVVVPIAIVGVLAIVLHRYVEVSATNRFTRFAMKHFGLASDFRSGIGK